MSLAHLLLLNLANVTQQVAKDLKLLDSEGESNMTTRAGEAEKAPIFLLSSPSSHLGQVDLG